MDDQAHTSELEALRRQVQTAWCDQRDLYLTRLLYGGYFQSAEDALEAGRTLGLEFPHPDFTVLSARLETWGELFTSGQMDRRDCNFILRNALEDGFPGVTHAADIQGKMVAILNRDYRSGMDPRGVVQDVQHILEVLEEEFGLTVTVAISRNYHGILELPPAQEDVEHIFDYLQLMGEDAPVTTFDELTHLHTPPSQTSYLTLESRLLGCVRASDFQGAQRVLHELIQGEFGDARPTVDTVRFRVYGVVNTMLYLISDIQAVVGREVIHQIDPGPRLTSARSLEEIVAVMDDILDQLSRNVNQKQSEIPGWVKTVRSYVEENFRDPNVTVSSVADHFGLTSTYCSKLFKEHYGIRLFDFIQLHRLEAAKDMMRSDKPLREIAEATGFSTALTMNRAFKRYEGTTPNRLRETRQK